MLEIIPIKAFNDNYLWLFKDQGSQQACIVDPGDASVVINYLQEHKLELAAILITHHHNDHTGGIEALLQHYDIPVYGPDSSNIPAITHCLQDGDSIELFDKTFNVIEIPGHTMDHIAYYTEPNDSAPILFCGDTLFAGGCGRVFEGTYEMMHNSLQKLAALSPTTQVYCAHEYTMSNLSFAQAVSPEDTVLARRIALEQDKRDNDIPTVPTSIAVELESNPFLLCADNNIISSAQKHSGQALTKPEDIFGILRQWKDSY